MAGGFQDVRQDPETGQLWVQERGTEGYRQASQAEVDASFEGAGEGVWNSAGRAVETLERTADQLIGSPVRSVLSSVLGGREGLTPEESEANLARIHELQAVQEAGGQANPIGATIGQMAPDAALGVATLGASLPATLGGRAGLFALEGAAMGALGDVDNPLAGAALGGALALGGELGGELVGAGVRGTRGFGRGAIAGQRVADGVVDEAASLAENIDALRGATRPGGLEGYRTAGRSLPADAEAAAARRSVGAAENPDPDVHQGVTRQLEGIADASEMLANDFPMTDTQARMLDATNGMELQALRAMDNQEEVASRTRSISVKLSDKLGRAPKVMDRGILEQEQQAWVNKTIAEEMGITGKSALDTNAIDRRVGELRGEFERINRETPGPIDMRGMGDAWERILDRNLINEGNPAYNTAERIYADLASRARKDATGRLVDADVGKMAQMRNKLTERIDAAAKTPRNLEVANVLKELRDELDKRFQKNWSAETKEDYATTQKQWFVAKAALKTRAAVGARGDMNLATFMGNYEGAGSTRATGLLKVVNPDFTRRMKSAAAVLAKETGDTGSGQTATEGILSGLADLGISQIPGVNLLR